MIFVSLDFPSFVVRLPLLLDGVLILHVLIIYFAYMSDHTHTHIFYCNGGKGHGEGIQD